MARGEETGSSVTGAPGRNGGLDQQCRGRQAWGCWETQRQPLLVEDTGRNAAGEEMQHHPHSIPESTLSGTIWNGLRIEYGSQSHVELALLQD